MAKSSGGGLQCSQEGTPTGINAPHRLDTADAAWAGQRKSTVCFRGQLIGAPAIDKFHVVVRNQQIETEFSDHDQPQVLEFSETESPGGFQCSPHEAPATNTNALHRFAIADASNEYLNRSMVGFRNQPQGATFNYDQVLLRSFNSGAFSLIMKGEFSTVKNILEHTRHQSSVRQKSLFSDSCETDIARGAAYVDFGTKWILLCAYTEWTGPNSLAECPNFQMAMRLILRLCLLGDFDIFSAVLRIDDCSSVVQTMVFFRSPIALAFLKKGAEVIVKFLLQNIVEPFKHDLDVVPEILLSNFVEMATGRVPLVLCGLWWVVLLATYIKWNEYSCQWAIALMPDSGVMECLSTSPAFLFSSGFSTCPRTVMDSFEARGPDNIAVICMDEPMDNFFASYVAGIGRLRWRCKTKGRYKDVSHIYGCEMHVFTTPPGGSFNFRLEYGGRALTFTLYGRNLYVKGWRVPHGTIEIKATSEIRRNYMSGDRVMVLATKSSYRTIAPGGKVENTQLGPYALREAFETLYRSRGEKTQEVKQALATVSVHFPEAGRLQNIFRDICTCFKERCMIRVGDGNAFWIRNYGHYSGQGLGRVNARMTGDALGNIQNRDGADISEVQILTNIRIFLRDGYNRGEFAHEPAPEDFTEAEPGWEDDADYLRSLEGKRSHNKRKRSNDGRKGKLKVRRLEECPTEAGDGDLPSFFPPYLLEELYPVVNEDELKESNKKAEPIAENCDGENEDERKGNENEGKSVLAQNTFSALIPAGSSEELFAEFFDHFPAAKKMLDFQRKEWSHLEMPVKSIERLTTLTGAISPAREMHSSMKKSIMSSSRAIMASGEENAYAGRKIIPQTRPFQLRVLNAGLLIIRAMRYVP